MRRYLVFLAVIFLCFIFFNVNTSAIPTGEVITTRASEQFGMNISVSNATLSPPETPPASPPGGGGGGTTVSKKVGPAFETDKELIKVQLKVEPLQIGEELNIPLKITNTYSGSLDFNIESNLNELLTLSETEFSIEKDQSKDISLLFKAGKDFEPGIYPGKITITTEQLVKEIPVVVEVKTKKTIFDVSLDIPPKYKEIFAGEKIVFQITLFNLGEVEKADVLINYFIKDFEGEIVDSQEETIKVEDQTSFSRTMKTSKDLKVGEYVLGVQAKYQGAVGTSSDIFRIKEKKSLIGKSIYYILFGLTILVIIFIIILLKREHQKLRKSVSSMYKRKTNKETEKQEAKVLKKAQSNRKIKDKLEALEKAYHAGYVSKEAYKKSEERIKKLLNR